jgi:hypothetical protein
MRRAIWTALAILGAPLAGADSPVCCRIFEIDATPILGNDPAVCGKIPDADTSEDTRDERRRATRCALEAQSQDRAFVYTYRELITPDIDLIVQALFGVRGERLLLKTGSFGAEDVRMAEVCTRLTVLPDGKLRGEGCTSAHSFIDQMRIAPW